MVFTLQKVEEIRTSKLMGALKHPPWFQATQKVAFTVMGMGLLLNTHTLALVSTVIPALETAESE